MRTRISFQAGILIGLAGWGLMTYPRARLLYDQIASEEVARDVYTFVSSGMVGADAGIVGLSLLPAGPLLFLTMLYLELFGKINANARRAAAGVGAALMLIAASWTAPMLWPLRGGEGTGRTFLFVAGWLLNLAFVATWELLMVVFAVRRAPLRDRITAATAESIALVGAFSVCLIVISLAAHTGFRLRSLQYPVADALQIAAAALMVVFAISARDAASLARQTAG